MKARLPQGYGSGGAQNLQQLARQAQKMQDQMEEATAELNAKEYTASSGGGMVTVTISGELEIKKLDINPEVVDPEDIEMLSDLITAAVNEAIRTANTEKLYAENKAAGEKYLAENAKKEGVKTTKSGLQYKVLVEGNGAMPSDTAKVQVNYEGKLIDGTVFDSSYERNQPFTVDLAQPRVIAGWIEALKMMPVGSKWEVTIPQELAYGAQNQGVIKPFSTLVFTIEVLK